MTFSVKHLQQSLSQLDNPKRYLVAYSGGLDSHVLLHALCSLRETNQAIEIHGIHINHGLSPHADTWAEHCLQECNELDVPCITHAVEVNKASEGLEAAARRARYDVFRGLVQKEDYLLTAHHQDDQAETLLLQLLRGSGPHGLASMPFTALFGDGLHVRPLLNVSRAALRDYATTNALEWVDDESNVDTSFDRNFLRHEVIPSLKNRWPALTTVLARSASHCAEAAGLLDELAAMDILVCSDSRSGALLVSELLKLTMARCRNVIRTWLRQQGLPLPNTARLQQIIDTVLHAAWDATPCVSWPGCEVRRYRDSLYGMTPLAEIDSNQVIEWDLSKPMYLAESRLTLQAHVSQGEGLDASLCQQERVTIRFRQGGEACQPVGRKEHHTLKHLFQEHGIPPWERQRIPLIYIGGKLAQVGNYWICEPFQVSVDESGYIISLVKE